MRPESLYDHSKLDFEKPLFDIEGIRRVNPQRNHMEQLTAIVHIDEVARVIVGYKDVTEKEFWASGHMPGYPLMPGVVQCECAAQLAGFYARRNKLLGGDFLGFGGMNDVRFRSPVYPDSRLILMACMKRVRPNRMAIFDFQGFVGDELAFSGEMIGVPITREHQT